MSDTRRYSIESGQTRLTHLSFRSIWSLRSEQVENGYKLERNPFRIS